MKHKILKFSTVILLFAFTAEAQEYQYVSFPDSNAVWSEVFWKSLSEPAPGWVYNKYALFNEDTVINGISYHKLFHTNNVEITRENSVCIGGIREENKKVFIQYMDGFKPNEPYYKAEFMLYNFGLNIGDTVWERKDRIDISPCDYLIVKRIDTILINNSTRKIFSFDIPWSHWIEGIGNVKGLIFTSGDLPTNGMNNDLICMHQNDSLVYYFPGEDNIYDSCMPTFVLNDVMLLPNCDIKVYPNPVNSSTVYFENLNFEILELFNINGKLVLKENIKGTNTYTLNVLKLIPGTYYYCLKTKGLVPTQGKLIIQKFY